MELLNVSVPTGAWVQVYDGTKDALIGMSGRYAHVCQSDTAPADNLIGFSLVNGDNRDSYTASKGSPVWAKAIIDPVIIIINA